MRPKEQYRLEIEPDDSHGVLNVAILTSIYEASFFPAPRRASNQRLHSNSESNGWLIDLRVPLADGKFLRPLALEMAALLSSRSIQQVAGAGYGAFFLIGGILAVGEGFKSGLIRESRKSYGLGKIVEGGLEHARPTFIVDDILSSGGSALRAAALLRQEGYLPTGVLTVCRYGWKQGEKSLRQAGLTCLSLVKIHRRCDDRPAETSSL